MNEWSGMGEDVHKNRRLQREVMRDMRHSTSGCEDMKKVVIWLQCRQGRGQRWLSEEAIAEKFQEGRTEQSVKCFGLAKREKEEAGILGGIHCIPKEM